MPQKYICTFWLRLLSMEAKKPSKLWYRTFRLITYGGYLVSYACEILIPNFSLKLENDKYDAPTTRLKKGCHHSVVLPAQI